ncbi:MAG: phenylalanine--tRNA ligase subunit alpha, partial [Mycobacteriaceae bacterium]
MLREATPGVALTVANNTTPTKLTEAALNEAASAAIQAFSEAPDLEELATAKSEHLGDKASLALAKRELALLPKDQRSEAGKLVNLARGAAQSAFAERREVLLAKRDAAVLVA